MTGWSLDDNMGFLPSPDPLTKLPSSPEFDQLECLGSAMPQLLSGGILRQELDRLPTYNHSTAAWDERNRLMLLYSYFASAYVWADPASPADRIPKGVAVPLVHLASKLERPPILSYSSYCLNNWRRIDHHLPVQLGNIELLQHFLGGKDEAGFILIHVDIEARARRALLGAKALHRMLGASAVVGPHMLAPITEIATGLRKMRDTLDRMPEECSPDVYFREVRPYIFGFEDVVYEGCFNDQPQSYRGETGAQSSIIPALLALLGIEHKDSILTRHLSDMQAYMPKDHRRFVLQMESGGSLRNFLASHRVPELVEAYNRCVRELFGFRSTHLLYAITYIQAKVANPAGTGGTPYMDWLGQLRDETLSNLL